jgi:hypothetical protein
MTAENLRRIVSAAVALENETGIPAELTAVQCGIESGWLDNAPGNNAFGLKADTEATVFQLLETEEELTPAQINSLVRSGKRIVNMGPLVAGRRIVTIQDKFMIFRSIDEAFRAYGQRMIRGYYFAPRWQRFLSHRSLPQLLRDLSGADGKPPYFTSRAYLALFDQISGQKNVQDALATARAANPKPQGVIS